MQRGHSAKRGRCDTKNEHTAHAICLSSAEWVEVCKNRLRYIRDAAAVQTFTISLLD
uniref:Uncharacterized protein n=1 Tax=Anguilla anguilla TaxID=7936 RepID=A0A0E9UTE6_ANGAN